MRAVLGDRAPVKGAAFDDFAMLWEKVPESVPGHRQAKLFLKKLCLSFVSSTPAAWIALCNQGGVIPV